MDRSPASLRLRTHATPFPGWTMEAAMLQRLHFLDKPSGCNGLTSTLSSLHRQCITCGDSTAGTGPSIPAGAGGTVGQKGSFTKPDRIRAGIAIPTETM